MRPPTIQIAGTAEGMRIDFIDGALTLTGTGLAKRAGDLAISTISICA